MVKLFDNHPIVLDKVLATKIGLNEAIVLQQVHYWLEINKKNKRNFHEGRYWTYNSMKKWHEEFPFWSIETVKRTFKRLREANLIITGNFNVYQMDRTLWYTINYEELESLCMDKPIGSDEKNDNCQNDQKEGIKKDLAIPENTTEISSEICTKSVSPSVNLKEGQIDQKQSFREKYEKILERCELYSIDSRYREGVKHAIKLILLDIENSKYIRIGDHNIPVEVVKEDMEKLNYFVIEHAIRKFQKACEEFKIRNTMAYLKACIYNSIHEMDMDIDSKLRYERIID